jgi:molybdate transport system substrate-binding protein
VQWGANARRGLIGIAGLAILLSGCGGDDSNTASSTALKVAAASSLRSAFEQYGATLDSARPSFSFAGSDQLAAQIRQGVKPDVFASANTKLPADLFSEQLVEQPVEFAANRLVVAVPSKDAKVRSLADLQRDGVRIAVGAPAVPIGAYTAQVIARMGEYGAEQVQRNIRSKEQDVASIAAKVAEGAVDAGFVYVTDVKASGGKLRAIELPARFQPRVIYAAAVVKDTSHAEQARQFIDGLLKDEGRAALREAGFEPPRG